MNQVILSGTVEKQIIMKKSKNGNTYMSNTIKVSRETNPSMCDYVDFICFGECAKMLENSYQGAMIEISGELQCNNYTDRNGNKCKSFSVRVNKLQLLDVAVNNDVDMDLDYGDDDVEAVDELPF